MDDVHRELSVVAMASQAAFADRCGIGQSVRSGLLVVVAGQAGGCDGASGRSESAGAGDRGLRADVVDLVGAGQVAGNAIAQIAGKANILIVGGSQDVGIRQSVAPVDAVNLSGETDALFGSAIGKRRIVANHAFLGRWAAAAVDEGQVLMAS